MWGEEGRGKVSKGNWDFSECGIFAVWEERSREIGGMWTYSRIDGEET